MNAFDASAYERLMLSIAGDMALARVICKFDPRGASVIVDQAVVSLCTTAIPAGAEVPAWPIRADPVLLFVFEQDQSLSNRYNEKLGEYNAERNRLQLEHAQRLQEDAMARAKWETTVPSARSMLGDLRAGKDIELRNHTLGFEAEVGGLTGTNPYGCDYFAGEMNLSNVLLWRTAMLAGTTLGSSPPDQAEDFEPEFSSPAMESLESELYDIYQEQEGLAGMANIKFDESFAKTIAFET